MHIHSLIKKMSLEEKIGQMFMLAFAANRRDEAQIMIEKHSIGACYLSQENATTPEEAHTLSRTLQNYVKNTPLKIPLLLGVDHEGTWGVLMPYTSTGPGNLALGATHNPEMTRQMYQILGTEMNVIGYNTILAPCADVNSNPLNPIIGMRSFGESPKEVGAHVAAAIRGAHNGGVMTTVKHFPGHGDTGEDSHRGLLEVKRTRSELNETDLFPFKTAIQAGVDIVMTSHILFPSMDPTHPATFSRVILQGLLREEMGFRGVILSDSMNMSSIRKNYPLEESSVMAVLAGVDMMLLAEEHYDHDSSTYIDKQLTMVQGLLKAVQKGRVPVDRIDGAVARILTLKKQNGLFEKQSIQLERVSIIGSSQHREIEQKASQAAVTVVRDTSNLLPLKKKEKIILINAVPNSAYQILTQTRGIGPNQKTPAFEAFKERLVYSGFDFISLNYEQLEKDQSSSQLFSDAKITLIVTEDYTLPGVDFDTESQKKLVKKIEKILGGRLIIVGLRTPYELAEYGKKSTYVCTCSSRPCAAVAAADVICGKISARGRLPVSIPSYERS
jgi:beta-N-acetylhexosaminidase